MSKRQRNMAISVIDEKLAAIEREIARLEERRAAYLDLKAALLGNPIVPLPPQQPRKRSANIKPLVLDIMASVGEAGATSAEVAEQVKERVPTVAKDTVGSTLSRLKADGALAFNGERYYEARFAPKSSPFEGIRIVK
jgi:hypothetical protein